MGGIDLCHSRRDDAEHLGDPQALEMAPEYGDTPPWHDVQAAITGPAVYDVETVFRERWEDPTPLTRHPVYWTQDKLLRMDMTPDPLPEQPPPPPPARGRHADRPAAADLPEPAPRARLPVRPRRRAQCCPGLHQGARRARQLIYIEDQYLWGQQVGDVFTEALRRNPGLHVIAVVPLFTDQEGVLARTPQMLGRARAMQQMTDVAPDRVAIYGIENHHGTPVYVHAKVCVMDDVWATVGSDNFNRRSWTHDSELSAVVVDPSAPDHSPYARRLRLTLAAEHLDREVEEDTLLEVMADCLDAPGIFAAYDETARALDDWHAGGQVGPRPPGRLRRLQPPEPGLLERALAHGALPAACTTPTVAPDGSASWAASSRPPTRRI